MLEVDARQPNEQFVLTLRKQESAQMAAVLERPIPETPAPERNTAPILEPPPPAVQTPGPAPQASSTPFAPGHVATLSVSPPTARSQSRRRVIRATVFGGVALAALGTGIAFTVLTHNSGSRIVSNDIGSDGQPARQCIIDGQGYECYLNLTSAYGVAYGVAALSAIGMGVTLGLK